MSMPAPASSSRMRGSVSFELTPIIASWACTNLSWYLPPAPSAPRSIETGPEDRPVLQHQADLAVVLHHLAQLRLELAAIGAIVVEPFDDGDVAIGIAGHGNVGVAQHQRFRQHLFFMSSARATPAPAGPRRRRTGQAPAGGLAPAWLICSIWSCVPFVPIDRSTGQDTDMLRAATILRPAQAGSAAPSACRSWSRSGSRRRHARHRPAPRTPSACGRA